MQCVQQVSEKEKYIETLFNRFRVPSNKDTRTHTRPTDSYPISAISTFRLLLFTLFSLLWQAFTNINKFPNSCKNFIVIMFVVSRYAPRSPIHSHTTEFILPFNILSRSLTFSDFHFRFRFQFPSRNENIPMD